MKKSLFISMLATFAFVQAFAGGYRVSLQGNRALAMGHTGVAVVNNAESAFFNPAGLVYLENKLNISAGGFGIFTSTKWQNTNTGQFAEVEDNVSTPFYLYGSYKINEWLTAGLSVTTPFGSRVEWQKDWPGSHLVNDIKLEAFFIQPILSIKLSKHFSIGGGPIYAIGNVNFKRNINRTLTDENGERSSVEIDASGVDEWGWNASFLFTPTEKLRIGFNYKSKIEFKAEDADATFTNIPNSSLVPVSNGQTTFNASLPMPAELTVGLSYEFNDKLLFAFDYNRAMWEAYDSLDIYFNDPNISPSFNPRNYENASTYRFGVQYEAMDQLTLRGGFYYDETPVQSDFFSPETPRNDSQGYTAGFTYDVNDKLSIDASFLYLRFSEVDASYNGYIEDGITVPFSGTYKSTTFIPGLGISYKL
ncbi:OmpP1/FadL family transporter [Psychroflexus sp. MBR-150]|jgi:long-chain fatty acid transport protein